MEAVKKKILQTRDRMGYSTDDMPIVFMGFKDSDSERQYFDRLGFQAFDSPVLAVVEWGNPARFGPKRVLDYAIARSATPKHVDFVVNEFLRIKNKPLISVTATPTPGPDPSRKPANLEIVNVRFEASGKPLFMTNAGVRIKNLESFTVRDIEVRFYCKLNSRDPWRLMGKKFLKKLPAGYFGSRDVVGDTKDFKLVDAAGNAVNCYYRVEVEQNGKITEEEGKFIPSEGPVGYFYR